MTLDLVKSILCCQWRRTSKYTGVTVRCGTDVQASSLAQRESSLDASAVFVDRIDIVVYACRYSELKK